MKLRLSVLSAFVLGLTVLGAGTAAGQDYPVKPIRLVTSPPGGGNDFTARLLAQGLANSMGQPFVVDNRPTILATELVFKAAPDGYTLLVAGSSFMTGHLLRETPWDALRDFAPVTLGGLSPNVVVVHPSLPVKNVKELIALAKARPGELNYGASAPGSTQYLSAELFKSMAGVNIAYVAFKGGGPSLIALMAGEIQMVITGTSTVEAHVKAGRLRALAVASAQPSPLAPGLPTVSATGLPGYEVEGIDAVYAPAGTPAAIINRLNREMARAIHKPDIKKKFLDSGTNPVGGSPEALGALVKSEVARWSKVIEAAGIGVRRR